jgi:large subunit ribosomal protein L21
MYAVIKVGGKQERVKPGDVIEVEFMHVDPGSSVEFQPLVVVDDDGKAHYGRDLSKARVAAKLMGDKKGDKVKVFKYRPKSGYRRTRGHRQLMTLLEIEEVGLDQDRVARREEPTEEPAEQKPAAKKRPARKEPAKKPASAKKPAAPKKPVSAKKPASAKRGSAKSASPAPEPPPEGS